MTTDWNWFFSSFAQSAAALLGILGAFVISRLLGTQEKIQQAIATFNSLRVKSQRVRNALAARNFSWYNQTRLRFYTGLRQAIRNGEFAGMSEAQIIQKIYNEFGFSLYKHDNSVYTIFSLMDAEEFGNNPNPKPPIPEPKPEGTSESMFQEKDTIMGLAIESLSVVEEFRNNRSEALSYAGSSLSLRNMIIFLMIAFPLTVIYPLHFMPMATNEDLLIDFGAKSFWLNFATTKGMLLLMFFLIIEMAFLYFLWLTRRLFREIAPILSTENEPLSDPTTYSPHIVWQNFLR